MVKMIDQYDFLMQFYIFFLKIFSLNRVKNLFESLNNPAILKQFQSNFNLLNKKQKKIQVTIQSSDFRNLVVFKL